MCATIVMNETRLQATFRLSKRQANILHHLVGTKMIEETISKTRTRITPAKGRVKTISKTRTRITPAKGSIEIIGKQAEAFPTGNSWYHLYCDTIEYLRAAVARLEVLLRKVFLSEEAHKPSTIDTEKLRNLLLLAQDAQQKKERLAAAHKPLPVQAPNYEKQGFNFYMRGRDGKHQQNKATPQTKPAPTATERTLHIPQKVAAPTLLQQLANRLNNKYHCK